MGLATTTLRIGLGGLMAGHGLQKLAGKFGGAGLDGTAAGFEAMGFRPGRPFAAAAGASETIGGGLLAAGMWTPLGAAMLTGVMATAIAKVHAKNGPWNKDNGYELNALIMAVAFALTEVGPGFPSVDGILTKRHKGFGWALAELAAGLGGAAAVMKLADRAAPPAGPGATELGDRPQAPGGTTDAAGAGSSSATAGADD